MTETDRMAMDAYLNGMETTQKQIDIFESKMASISKDDQRIRLLMTIPGINYTTALTVISEIVAISRFATPEKLVSYAGLAPSQRNSGETKKSGNITKHGSSWLRYAMVEAAHTTIQNDERIKKFYSRIASRRGPQKARVAAAKEMLVITWYMLTNMEPYRTQNHSMTEQKYSLDSLHFSLKHVRISLYSLQVSLKSVISSLIASQVQSVAWNFTAGKWPKQAYNVSYTLTVMGILPTLPALS